MKDKATVMGQKIISTGGEIIRIGKKLFCDDKEKLEKVRESILSLYAEERYINESNISYFRNHNFKFMKPEGSVHLMIIIEGEIGYNEIIMKEIKGFRNLQIK